MAATHRREERPPGAGSLQRPHAGDWHRGGHEIVEGVARGAHCPRVSGLDYLQIVGVLALVVQHSNEEMEGEMAERRLAQRPRQAEQREEGTRAFR